MKGILKGIGIGILSLAVVGGIYGAIYHSVPQVKSWTNSTYEKLFKGKVKTPADAEDKPGEDKPGYETPAVVQKTITASGEHSSVLITKGTTIITSGSKVDKGSKLTILASSQNERYSVEELLINGAKFVNGSEIVVGDEDINIVVVEKQVLISMTNKLPAGLTLTKVENYDTKEEITDFTTFKVNTKYTFYVELAKTKNFVSLTIGDYKTTRLYNGTYATLGTTDFDLTGEVEDIVFNNLTIKYDDNLASCDLTYNRTSASIKNNQTINFNIQEALRLCLQANSNYRISKVLINNTQIDYIEGDIIDLYQYKLSDISIEIFTKQKDFKETNILTINNANEKKLSFEIISGAKYDEDSKTYVQTEDEIFLNVSLNDYDESFYYSVIVDGEFIGSFDKTLTDIEVSIKGFGNHTVNIKCDYKGIEN